MLVKNRDFRIPTWRDVMMLCLDIEQGLSFKPRETEGVSSIKLMA